MNSSYWPLFGLAVRTPRLELRYPDDVMLARLIDCYQVGVHDPGLMPFLNAWTEVPSPEREWSSLTWWWRQRAGISPEAWALPFAVVVDGEVAGVQENGTKMIIKNKHSLKNMKKTYKRDRKSVV